MSISSNEQYSDLIALMKRCWSQERHDRPLFDEMLTDLNKQYDKEARKVKISLILFSATKTL